jgi:hypothetical protein
MTSLRAAPLRALVNGRGREARARVAPRQRREGDRRHPGPEQAVPDFWLVPVGEGFQLRGRRSPSFPRDMREFTDVNRLARD